MRIAIVSSADARPSGYRARSRRWLYRGGRPGLIARAANRLTTLAASAGVWRGRLVTVEVPGRTSGRLLSFPMVVADYEGERYLVAMLGRNANWVRNARAAGGHVLLRDGPRESVCLEEVDPGDRAPILRRYLQVAAGARAHMAVDRRAPLTEFERVAAEYPVFRIRPEAQESGDDGTQGHDGTAARP